LCRSGLYPLWVRFLWTMAYILSGL